MTSADHSSSEESSLLLLCPEDTQGDAHAAAAPLAPLLWHIPAEALVSLLAALLLERRVIVAAHDLDRLSRVVHAAATLLYPFQYVLLTPTVLLTRIVLWTLMLLTCCA